MAISESAGLLFRIKADPSDATKGLEKVKQELKDTGAAAKDTGASAGGELAAGFSAAGGVIAAATAVIVAAGAAVVVVGKQLYDLAEAARAAAAEIDKFQKLTNLSVESVQGLKVAAESVGDSLETVTEIWESFSELIIEAARGDEDATEKLVRNKINAKTAVNDLQGTFEKALKAINDMPPGFRQNAAAMDLMGESGLDMIPIIKAMDGDLKGFSKSLKDQGLIIDAEGIKKSKEYGKQAKELEMRFASLKNQIGLELMPAFIDLGKVATNFLKNNKADIIDWAKSVSSWITNAINNVRLWKAVLGDLALGQLSTMPNYTATKAVIESEDQKRRDQEMTDKTNDELEERRRKNQQSGKYDWTDTEDNKKKREEALKDQAEYLKKYNEQQIEANQILFSRVQKDNEELLEQNKITFEEYQAAALANIEQYANAVRILMEKGYQASLGGKDAKERVLAARDYQNELERFNSDVNNMRAALRKKEADAEKKAAEESVKLTEAEANRKIEIEKKRADVLLADQAAALRDRQINEYQYAIAVEKIRTYSLEYEKKILQEQLAGLDKRGEKFAEVTQRIALLDIELRKQMVENAEAVRQAIENTTEAREKMAGNAGEEGQSAPSDAPKNGGGVLGGLFGAIDWQGEADVIVGVGQMISDTFNSIAQAVGNSVRAFVLFGSAGGSFRKFAAELLASVAQMAAVQAVWNLAEGFAKLALAFFGHPTAGASATQHFIAAGVYATIGGVAAIAGRGLAGNRFQQQTATATGAGGGSTSTNRTGGAYSTREGGTIEQSRNSPAGFSRFLENFKAEVTLKLDSNGVLNVLKDDVRRNGQMRGLILNVVETS